MHNGKKGLLKGSITTLTNTEIKNIVKVTRSLGIIVFLKKEAYTKISCQGERFLNFCRPLMTAGLPLMENVLTALVKLVLVPLRLVVAASATDAAISKKINGSRTTARIIPNKERDNLIEIVK